MNSLMMLTRDMLSDERVVVIVGKDGKGNTKVLFRGTVLDVWKNRKGILEDYLYRDVIDIAPARIILPSGPENGLKITILCKYGFKED